MSAPTKYRGKVAIVDGADTTRHGYGDLSVAGVITVSGRSNVDSTITSSGTGVVSLTSTGTGNVALNTTAGGNVLLQTTTGGAINLNSNTSVGITAGTTISETATLGNFTIATTSGDVVVNSSANATITSINGNATLATSTTGNVVLSSIGQVNSTSATSTTIQTTNGTMTLTAGGATSDVAITAGRSITELAHGAMTLTNDGAVGTGNITVQSTGGSTGDVIVTTSNSTSGNVTISSSGATPSGAGLVTISSANNTASNLNSGIKLSTAGADIVIGPTNNAAVLIGSSGSNTTVKGNLTVLGTTTTVNSTTVTIDDNILLLNANAASGTVDSGLMVKRYQVDNDSSLGAIVTGGNYTETGTAQAGTGSSVTLAATASSTTDKYTNGWLLISAGLGAGQVRKITAYNSSTKVCTLSSALTDTLDGTSVYQVFEDKQYSGLVYKESANAWYVGSTATDPSTSSVTDLTLEDLHVRNLVVTGTIAGATEGFVNQTVSINENSTTPTTIAFLTKTRGCGIVMVTGGADTNACATFILSKSVNTESGQVQRLTSSSSTNTSVELDMDWPSSGAPRLFHTVAGSSNVVTYNVRFTAL
jgi:hypothetical protein